MLIAETIHQRLFIDIGDVGDPAIDGVVEGLRPSLDRTRMSLFRRMPWLMSASTRSVRRRRMGVCCPLDVASGGCNDRTQSSTFRRQIRVSPDAAIRDGQEGSVRSEVAADHVCRPVRASKMNKFRLFSKADASPTSSNVAAHSSAATCSSGSTLILLDVSTNISVHPRKH